MILCVLTLGIWGQYVLSPEKIHLELPTAIYQVVMLFALEGDWTIGIDLPWQLEVTRILAPLVSITGVLIVAMTGAWVSVTNSFIRFRDNHVVVIGLGEKGWQFAQSCASEHKVVVIERSEDNPYIERARNSGLMVIVGDALDESVMEKANIEAARHVVAFCGNDGASVEFALRLRERLWKQKASQELRIHLHVSATRVSSRLENYAKFYDDQKVAEVNFFNVNDLTARILLKKYPPDEFGAALGQHQVHIALYGFGRLAEHILTETVRICHFLNSRPVKFSIFDSDVRQKARALLSLHPGIEQLSEINFVEMEYLHPLHIDAVDDDLLASVTEHVVCLPTDEENLELSLMLRSALLERTTCNAPINVRMQHASGLARLLESTGDSPEIPDGIYPFGMLDEVLYHENILSDRLDELARAMHSDYLERRAAVHTDHRLYTSLNPWSTLPEPVRKSNRLQADHMAAKLRAVRCRTAPGMGSEFQFTDEEATALARMEHERWRANKLYEGWKKGDERIEGAKINPYTVPWQDIDPAEQADQIESVKRLPSILREQMGQHIRREVYIGITGHRPHRVDLGNDDLLARINETLAAIAGQYPDRQLIIVSPLAEGADRVVAKLAIERYNMKLHVPLPLPFELYHTDFESVGSMQEFKRLVGVAETYFEMPMRFGSIETLASRVDGKANEARNKQYALVGAYLVQTCHELIGVWDGKPESGTGGTPEILRWRNDGVVPEDYRIDTEFFLPPKIKPAIVIDSLPVG